jgi:hypothetical protein
MNDIFQWLTNYPIIITLLVFILLVVVIMFLIAFIQGREISFYPPKIGPKIETNFPDNKSKNIIQKDRNPELIRHSDIKPDPHRIAIAKRLDWISVSLNNTFPNNNFEYAVTNCLKEGGQVRILIVDPNSDTPKDLASLGYFSGKHEKVIQNINETIERVSEWKKIVPDGNVEIRYLYGQPPYRMSIVDRFLPSGYLNIRLPIFHGSKDIPTIRITAELDQEWFNFFCEQFDKYWNVAKRS